MKIKQEQLISRGYLAKGVESEYLYKSFDEKIELLHSITPTDRTLGTRLLANSKNGKAINYLISALAVEKKFNKNSYPLPRDIASRTLVRFGQAALDELEKVLNNRDKKQLSEAIDAVGFICFYDCRPGVYKKLKKCYSKNSQNDLIRWKIIRAMSGFPESEPFLQEQKQVIHYKRLQKEIERSLLLIKKRT